VGLRIFFKKPFSIQVFLGSILGGFGILLLFWDSIQSFQTDYQGLKGLGLGIIATCFASVGNLVSVRNSYEKMPILSSTSWSLLYGSLFTLILLLIFQQPLVPDFSISYLVSLLYLAVFGTVIGFAAYLTLIARIGADQAAYTSILTPVIALILSGLFEQFQWQWWTWVGIILCGLGNYLALHWKPKWNSY